MPPPVWTGMNVGIHGGYLWGSALNTTNRGAVGGGQIGFNFHLPANIILGVEGDAFATGIVFTQNATLLGIATVTETRVFAMGTGRGRIGYAFDRFVVYGTAGLAWSANRATQTIAGAQLFDAKLHTGFAYGGGVDWMIAPKFTLRAEYLRINLGSQAYFSGLTTTGKVESNIGRFGINYVF
jgi:outer membrane immunogenic protein